MIINQCELGYSNATISENVGVKRQTVASIVKSYLLTGKTECFKRGGDFSSKLDDDKKLLIRSWVDEDATITLKTLRLKLLDECGISVSVSTINRCLKEFHYSLKILTIVPERRNSDNTIEQRFIYAQEFNSKLLEAEGDNFVFIDEVGFNVSSRTRQGRSLAGTSAYVNVKAIKSRNISVIAAMNKYGMVLYKINRRPVNGEDFKDYLKELANMCCSMEINDPCFILDNARIHHYRGLDEVVESLKLKLMYLPPYSPFLNPIENVFSKWKNNVVRAQARNENELLNLIDDGFKVITANDCSNYYRKMLRYISRCLNREIILE